MEWKINLVLILFLSLAFLFFNNVFVISGENGNPVANLTHGKNIVVFENYTLGIYASHIIELNRDIQLISYFDESLGRDVGYVNVFGGIGNNFLILPNVNYGVFTEKNITLYVP